VYVTYLGESVSVTMRRPAEVLLATAQAAGGTGKLNMSPSFTCIPGVFRRLVIRFVIVVQHQHKCFSDAVTSVNKKAVRDCKPPPVSNKVKTSGYAMWSTAAPNPPKYKFFLGGGVTQPPGVAQPLYSGGTQLDPDM